MAEQRLELVTSFSQLGVGMKVVIRRSRCGCAEHSGILMPDDGTPTEDGSKVGYMVLPRPDCAVFSQYRAFAITPKSVAERKVYRVVDEQWERERDAYNERLVRKRLQEVR